MSFEARWEFSVGAQLKVTLEAGLVSRKRVSMEGIVVDSKKLSTGMYNTTVLFLEHSELNAGSRASAEKH